MGNLQGQGHFRPAGRRLNDDMARVSKTNRLMDNDPKKAG